MSLDSYYAVLVLLAIVVSVKEFLKRSKLQHIPTIGYSFPLLSYVSAFRYFRAGRAVIEEGQRRYPNSVWKIATLDGWFVIANGTKRLEEMSKAPEDQLSAGESFKSYMQLDYTLGPEVTSNPYHITTVRTSMTRNIGAQFADMRDEMTRAIEDVLPPSRDDDWVAVRMYGFVLEVTSRISARLAVGYPLCNNREFRDLCSHSGTELMKGRKLRYFPTLLKPLASKYLLGIHGALDAVAEHLRPHIEDRVDQERLNGPSWDEKPNDLLTWCLEEAERTGSKRTPLDMAKQIYFISFAAHVTSVVLICALYELATREEYVAPLRAEISDVLSKEGWTKEAFSKMWKLDSFLREVQRCFDTQLLHLGRKVLKDFTFSDGTVVPAGSILYVNSHGMHHDEKTYPDPHSFNGFRYVCEENVGVMDNVEGKEKTAEKQQQQQLSMARPTLEYNAFGYGKHACPGRFIATYQLKTIMAHLILTYDIKTEGDGRPPGMRTESETSPDTEAKIFLRKRMNTEAGKNDLVTPDRNI